MARPPRAAQIGPCALCFARRRHCGINITWPGLCQRGQHLARSGVAAVWPIARWRKASIDELPEPVALIHQPRQCICGAFGGRAIAQRLIVLMFGHFLIPISRIEFAPLLYCALAYCMAPPNRPVPAYYTVQFLLDIAQQGGCPKSKQIG